jgi:hypothetical protein
MRDRRWAGDDEPWDAAPAGASVALREPEAWTGNKLPSYLLPGDGLEMGASLSNAKCWVNIRGNGDIESLFSVDIGLNAYGAMGVRYASADHQAARAVAQPPAASEEAADASARAYARPHTPLLPDGPGQVELHPAYQRRTIELPGNLLVEETLCVPRVAGPERGATYDGPVAYQIVDLWNHAPVPRRVRVYGYAQLRGQSAPDLQVSFDPSMRQGALVAHNASQLGWVRIFGAAGEGVRVAGYGSSYDDSQIYDLAAAYPLRNSVEATGDVIGALQVNADLAPGERRRFAFIAVFSPGGEAEARRLYAHAWDFEGALRDTIAHYARVVGVTEVLTPDPVLNEGVVWAKTNMLRVMAHYPQGWAFTNEPGQSSSVVARDAAWFVYGGDYLLPAFSRALLEGFARRQEPSGKIVEYYNAITGATEDYGLNINDDTPLFIAAADHHYRATGDAAFLLQIYPAVARAAYYILSQLDTHLPDEVAPSNLGLVHCTARGESVHGIAGWRNIIPGYSLSGAVTELNAECVGALRAASYLAGVAERPPEEVDGFRQAAEDLTGAINRHLLNPENGMYYLNIDPDGNHHTSVTADELFPVMFGVAPEEVAYRIISRLRSPDFWTPAGIRTVSRQSLDYSAYRAWGLMGGVWPGVTWWLAIAAGRYHPSFMVRALRASFEHFARDPRTNHTVPGQFSEWFDGESLVNRGMRLSPWEPPRFLWAAVEGVCGVTSLSDRFRLRPLLPADWKWVALRRLLYHGAEHAFFGARQGGQFCFYTTGQLEVPPGAGTEVFAEDVTPRVSLLHRGAHHVALRRPDKVVVCVGSARDQTIVVPIHLRQLLDPARRYAVALYNSERDAWEFGGVQPAALLRDLSMIVEAGGFRVLALTPE